MYICNAEKTEASSEVAYMYLHTDMNAFSLQLQMQK